MKTLAALFMVLLLLLSAIQVQSNTQDDTIYDPTELSYERSTRLSIADALIVPDNNPFFLSHEYKCCVLV